MTTCILLSASGAACSAFADDLAAGSAPGPQISAQARVQLGDETPYTVRLLYTGEEAYNAQGGLHDGGAYMNNVFAQLHIDAKSAFGLAGGSFDIEGFYENKTSLDSQYVGAIQDPSVIDTSGVPVLRLYQAYYKQSLGDTNLLFGVYDPQTEFGLTKPMDIFFNGAYAWTTTLDQSGLNGPSAYPSTSVGFRIRQKLGPHWRVQLAVLDGVPDSLTDPRATAVNFNRTYGALLLGEVSYVRTRTTKIIAGIWHYTGLFPEIEQPAMQVSTRTVSGSTGGYLGGATRLYGQASGRALDAFGNIGVANARTQVVDGSLNAGLTFTGWLSGRPADKFGIAVGVARVGDAYRHMQLAAHDPVGTYETNFEATYRAPITKWLTIQPDVQYWVHPDVDPNLKNDLLLMIHFEISHAFNL